MLLQLLKGGALARAQRREYPRYSIGLQHRLGQRLRRARGLGGQRPESR